MEGMFLWIKNIAFFLILSGLLTQLLSDGKYRKYLKFFTGLVLMILVASPVNRWFGLEEQLVRAAEDYVFRQQSEDIKEQMKLTDEDRMEHLEREYEAIIEEQVSRVAEAYGYEMEECRAKLQLDLESEDFGGVISLAVVLRTEREGMITPVDPVQIGEEVSAEEEDSSSGLSDIRAELEEMYSLEQGELRIRRIE